MAKRSGKNKPNFYAVSRGKTIGIFEEWLLTCQSVNGFSNCAHQGFKMLSAAVGYLQASGISDIHVHTSQGSTPLNKYNNKSASSELPTLTPHQPRQESQVKADSMVDPDETELKMRLKPTEQASVSNPSTDDLNLHVTVVPDSQSLDQSIDLSAQCIICEQAASRDVVKCSNCNCKVHYRCSCLPAYQISNLVTNHRRFTCELCTIVKPEITQALGKNYWPGADFQAALTESGTQTLPDPALPTDPASDHTTSSKDNLTPPQTVPPCVSADAVAVAGECASPPVTVARIDKLESALTTMLQGLCQDVQNAKTQQLLADLNTAHTECVNMKTQLDSANRKYKDAENQLSSHTCKTECTCVQTQCDCTGKQQAMAQQVIELDITISNLNKHISSLKDTIKQQETDIQQKNTELDKLSDTVQAMTITNEDLQAQIDSTLKALQETRDNVRALELQLEGYTDQDTTGWADVVKGVVKVKGAANPMSNFFPCNIPAFGQTFDSVEHGYHFKKAMDHDLFNEAEIIKSQPTAKEAKAKADELIGKLDTREWEEKSLSTLRFLLKVKKESCSEFVTRLGATGNKSISHNVASDYWGTGTDGKGKNVFGKLLMEVRDGLSAIAPATVPSTPQPPASTPSTTPPVMSSTSTPPSKPDVLLLGNSLLNGVRGDKFSRDFHTTVKTAYTIKEAQEAILHLDSKPSAIAIQLITNEVKTDQSIADIVQEYNTLVQTIQENVSGCKILISQAPNKISTVTKISTRTTLVNACLADKCQGTDIVCIDNSNVKSFASDNIHLSKYGTSMLVRNIKAAIEESLGTIPSPWTPPDSKDDQQSQTQHQRSDNKDDYQTRDNRQAQSYRRAQDDKKSQDRHYRRQGQQSHSQDYRRSKPNHQSQARRPYNQDRRPRNQDYRQTKPYYRSQDRRYHNQEYNSQYQENNQSQDYHSYSSY